MTKNLLRRKARTALTVAGVAIGVGLIVALLSITNGVKRTAAELIHVGRSDFGLFQSGAADLTRSLLPEELAGNVRRSEGVSQVARVFLLVGAVEQSDSSLLFGYVPGEFPERSLVVVSGRRRVVVAVRALLPTLMTPVAGVLLSPPASTTTNKAVYWPLVW